jgi:outer membrane protein assembly factor BamB
MLSSHFAVDLCADDWPQWRGPGRDGISKEAGFSTDWPRVGPKSLWRASVGSGFSSLAVSKGRLFTIGTSNGIDTVYCLASETGQPLWKFSYPSPPFPESKPWLPAATPTVEGDVVYTFSLSGKVFCLEAASGQVRWSNNIPEQVSAKCPQWGFASSPVSYEDLLILNAGGSGVALAKAWGKVAWSSGPGPGGFATPVLFKFGNQTGAAIFSDDALIAVEPSTGKELWRHPWRGGVHIADPVVCGDTVFISTAYGKGAALIRFGSGPPSLVWANQNMVNHFNTCVLIDGHLYGINCDAARESEGNLRCLELKTGAVKWTHEGTGAGTQMAVGDTLVVLTGKGELIVAQATPTVFKPLARAQVLGGRCWTVPVFANGRLYCRNEQGDLVCLDVKERRTSPFTAEPANVPGCE